MITKATKNAGVSESTAVGYRIIPENDGDIRTVVVGHTLSKTLTLRDIIETPIDTLPDNIEETPEQIPDILKGMVFADELTEQELLDIISLYRAWDDMEVGEWVEVDTLLSHENKLYRVVQRHQKQTDWVPGIGMDAVYTNVMPAGVIAEWVQPQGAHDAYQIGDMVTYNGQTWVCIAGDANGNNSWAPGVYGWEVVE